MTLVFERREPLVCKGGDAAEYQVGDAWDARWVAQLSEGWAVVTQTFYRAQYDEGQTHIPDVAPGVQFVESQVEYMWCTDPANPGSSEITSSLEYIVLPDDDPRALCEQAVDTTAEEWERYRPSGAPAR